MLLTLAIAGPILNDELYQIERYKMPIALIKIKMIRYFY
jgi:hypothetical protein